MEKARSGLRARPSAAKEKPIDTAYGGATLLPASETTKKDE